MTHVVATSRLRVRFFFSKMRALRARILLLKITFKSSVRSARGGLRLLAFFTFCISFAISCFLMCLHIVASRFPLPSFSHNSPPLSALCSAWPARKGVYCNGRRATSLNPQHKGGEKEERDKEKAEEDEEGNEEDEKEEECQA